MGCLSSKLNDTAAEARNRAIEQAMVQARQADFARIKLLLLGAGESGKSTFFKQMRIVNSNGFTIEEKEAILPNIHAALVEAYQTVLKNSKRVKNKSQADAILGHHKDALLTPSIGRAMQELWADPAVKAAWMKRSEYQVTDSLAWFVMHLDRISAKDYIPNEQDMLHVRVRTSGIIEEKFTLKGVEFNVFDVGGQRNERKKWIHCFEDVTAVMFFVALSEYDQVLYEDQSTKRMDEALTLFDDICNSRFFTKTSMMLFLNKDDLFREKLAEVPFRVNGTGPDARFQDYNGPVLGGRCSAADVYTGTLKYLTDKYVHVNRNPKKRVYVHVTCATDTSNISKVFESCKDIIAHKALESGGFS